MKAALYIRKSTEDSCKNGDLKHAAKKLVKAVCSHHD